MHMIRHHVAFNDAAFLLPGQFMKDWPQRFADVAKQRFTSSLRDKDNVILAIPTGMRQALIGVRHGFSFGVLSSSHRGRTLLPDRSKLCSSHWSNQWLTSKTELRQGIVRKKPSPTLTDEVECDEVSIVAGHKGKPEEVKKKGGAAGADDSKGNADVA